jgi:hypothetical protein
LTSGRTASTEFSDGNNQIVAGPSGVTFDFSGLLFNVAGCSVQQNVGPPTPLLCNGQPCVVDWINGVTFATFDASDSISYTAAPTSLQGGSFINWTASIQGGSPFIVSSQRTFCFATAGPITNQKFTANYTCARPTITCPANLTLNAAPDTCAATATYSVPAIGCNGSQPTVTCTRPSGSSFTAGTTPVTCTATIPTGSAQCSFNVTVNDNQDPVITCPADVVDECPLDSSGTATVTDNCPGATVSQTSAVETPDPTCGGAKEVVRTFTATDAAGRTATCAQTIDVVDTLDPTVSAPGDVTLACLADTSPAATGSATGSDLCTAPTIGFSDVTTPGCGQTVSIQRSWTSTDACGHSVVATQTITTVDEDPPSLTVPPSVTFECASEGDPGAAQSSDTCGSVAVGSSDTVVEGCGNTRTITRSYTATDSCGNTAGGEQTITVVDTTAPTVVAPDDASVECGDAFTPDVTGNASGADACGGVSQSFSDSPMVSTCGRAGVVTRTFSAVDECSNESSDAQTIAIVDSTAPTITAPADETVECNASFTDPGATATDRCEGDLGAIAATGSVDTAVPGGYLLTYSAGDGCANSASVTRQVTVVDTTAPSITCPASQTLPAACSGGGVSFPTATAGDSCGAATVACTENGAPPSTTPGTHHLTCTATDASGNRASCSYTVEVEAAGGDIIWKQPVRAEGKTHVFKSGKDVSIKVRGVGCNGAALPKQATAFVEVRYDADGDGTYETDLRERSGGHGGSGGLMDRGRRFFRYDLDTHGYASGTERDARSFRLTVRIFVPSPTGPALLREEHIVLESKK